MEREVWAGAVARVLCSPSVQSVVELRPRGAELPKRQASRCTVADHARPPSPKSEVARMSSYRSETRSVLSASVN